MSTLSSCPYLLILSDCINFTMSVACNITCNSLCVLILYLSSSFVRHGFFLPSSFSNTVTAFNHPMSLSRLLPRGAESFNVRDLTSLFDVLYLEFICWPVLWYSQRQQAYSWQRKAVSSSTQYYYKPRNVDWLLDIAFLVRCKKNNSERDVMTLLLASVSWNMTGAYCWVNRLT